jgi:hypothetical protein
MAGQLITAGQPVYLVRDESFEREIWGLSRLGLHGAVATAREMETEISRDYGMPHGSYAVSDLLRALFSWGEWELMLWAADTIARGNRELIEKSIRGQYVYEKGGVAIVYQNVRVADVLIVSLHTVNVIDGWIPGFNDKLFFYPRSGA